jgi:hypothetical protein
MVSVVAQAVHEADDRNGDSSLRIAQSGRKAMEAHTFQIDSEDAKRTLRGFRIDDIEIRRRSEPRMQGWTIPTSP